MAAAGRSEAVIVLVIGGTRSGKSEVAELLAARHGEPVIVVVPAVAGDAEMQVRIQQHRARRPSSWPTVECGPELIAAVRAATGTVLIDSLGTWLAATDDLAVDAPELVAALTARDAATVVVSEEVGLAVHPPTDVGRAFVDALGALNTAVSAAADEVVLVVAGRVLPLQELDR